MKTRQDHLKEMFNQVKHLELGLLLSGLTILVRDTADYINAGGFTDPATEGFRTAYLDMLNYDRYYWGKFGQGLLLALPDAKLPFGIAKEASRCTFDLSPLLDHGIEHEWTRAPGWHFFQTYSKQTKSDILSGGTTIEQLKASFCNAKEPHEPFAALTDKLAKTSSFGPGFWYPLMLYMALVLHKTDFRTLN